MKTIFFLFFILSGLTLHAANFPLGGFRLRLYSRDGAVISHILRGPSRIVRHTGTLREQAWASNRFEVRCRISKNLPGEYRMQWQIKALNGIPEGAFIELTCHAEPEWKIRDTGEAGIFLLMTPEQKWRCKIEGALLPALFRQVGRCSLHWYWNYDPRDINTINLILTMTAAQRNPLGYLY